MGRHLPTLNEWSDFAGLRQIWDERLPDVLRRANRSDFYRGRFGTDPATLTTRTLAGLPLTRKDDLRACYPFGMVAVPRRELISYHESSGTSPGQTTASFHTEADWSEMVERFGRGRQRLTDTDTVLVRVPYAMVTIAHQVHAAAREARSMVVPADARSTAMTYPRVLGLLRDVRVTVAAALPTEPLLWAACARMLDESPREFAPDLRTLILTGEPLSPARRSRIQELWGCDATVSYGNSECGSNLAGECPEGVLHLWADRYLPEILDPRTGSTSEEGRGRLLLTTLVREAMPLVRYDTGDAVELSYDDCACGWALPRIRVLGRWEQGVTVEGRLVFVAEVEEAVYRLPAELGVLFWRATEDKGSLRVLVEAEATTADRVTACLTDLLTEQLGVQAAVTVVAPGTLVDRAELVRESHIAKPRYLSTSAAGAAGLLYPPPAGGAATTAARVPRHGAPFPRR
ncbi:phenylacetate--CoA ligase family protein [Spiractinospora alimapuensis]|uniref:phenylacetate--CoA ligase family protein n=1 Tax=Spiractinospora alimapuensis TaxID=2820884 RepID=UPI001F3A69C5|nr:AMP-binding protein [Spiractinospora alimapuensis]QVQ52344.1 phenylacetate--CoA ligase family protein [Spiractinospora alimapuensis]